MRTRLASICLLASALLITPTASHAQGQKAAAAAASKDPKKGDATKGGKPKEVKLDDDAGEGPVTAGQMTEQAAQGKRLFDAERWGDAALLLKKVVDGETATTRATSRSRSTTSRSRSTACSSTRRATASSPRSRTSRTT